MEIKCLDQKGIDFLIKEEGCILHPYLDSVGVPTIGVGNTYYPDGKRVTMQDPPITKEMAMELFRIIVKQYETTVWSVTRDDINQNQFNALVSICYNIGVNGFKKSTLLKRVNENPKQPSIRDAFLMWNKPKELIKRRKREATLYFS